MSPSLRSTHSKKTRRSKHEANIKLRQLLRNKTYTQRISKSNNTRRKAAKQVIRNKPKMGQKFSSYVRKGHNRLKDKSPEDARLQATNIEEVPHPNETLGLRIKLFGPTNIILVIRTNSSYEDSTSTTSPIHNSSSVYCRIHAHREVLCMRSKYFQSMLQGPYQWRFQTTSINTDYDLEFCEKNDDEINLVSIYRKTPSEMADMVGQILHFAYFDQRALNPDNVQTLLEAANYFQVKIIHLQHYRIELC